MSEIIVRTNDVASRPRFVLALMLLIIAALLFWIGINAMRIATDDADDVPVPAKPSAHVREVRDACPHPTQGVDLSLDKERCWSGHGI